MHWYFDVLSKYAVFEGRARRKEYWMFLLFSMIVGFVLGFIDGLAGLNRFTNGINPLGTIYNLAIILPSLGVAIRRLHDTGRSGWWYLLVFTCVGGIVLLIWFCEEGTNGRNEYGPDPKALERRALEEGDEELE